MKLNSTYLPWNNTVEALTTGNLCSSISATLSASQALYLPGSIELFVEPEVASNSINSFLGQLPGHLKREFDRREERIQVFADLGLIERSEMIGILTKNQNRQPWALCLSKEHGLKFFSQKTDSSGNVIPCSSMQNHGIAHRDGRSWLVTAPKVSEGWDWDSDIGHESGHGAFAPIPAFVNTLDLGSLTWDTVGDLRSLSTDHIVWLIYMFCELSVVAIRGEPRPTDTGLPVAETPEILMTFLRLGHELAPKFGFDQATGAFKESNGQVPVNSALMYFVGAPILRTMSRLACLCNRTSAPTVDELKELVS